MGHLVCVLAVNTDKEKYVGFRWAFYEFLTAHKGPTNIGDFIFFETNRGVLMIKDELYIFFAVFQWLCIDLTLILLQWSLKTL